MALRHFHRYIKGNCRVASANHQSQQYGTAPNRTPFAIDAKGAARL
jgi:hypothetical protein